MAYTAWSVVAFEQPTAAKWNQLGENDAGFKDGTNFDDDIIGKRHIDWDDGIWWEELGRTTLGSTADTISVNGFTAKKYLRVIVFIINSGSVSEAIRFNGDSGNNYANRSSTNGGADVTVTSAAQILYIGGSSYSRMTIFDIINTAAQEKSLQLLQNRTETAGAGNAPTRIEMVAKWANTSAQITRVDILNNVGATGTGDYAAGSEVVVLGHD